jgi:hypothetical protein
MGVENTNVVDLLGIDPKSDMVTLTVVDTLDWQNEEEHVARLQEKLNTYLRFIESDEIDQTYPKASAKNVASKYSHSTSRQSAVMSF